MIQGDRQRHIFYLYPERNEKDAKENALRPRGKKYLNSAKGRKEETKENRYMRPFFHSFCAVGLAANETEK